VAILTRLRMLTRTILLASASYSDGQQADNKNRNSLDLKGVNGSWHSTTELLRLGVSKSFSATLYHRAGPFRRRCRGSGAGR